MSKHVLRGIGLAAVLAAMAVGPVWATLVANFDDGTSQGFVPPSGGLGTWTVLQPDGSPWVPASNGVLWQTDPAVNRGGLEDRVFVRRPDTITGSYTNSFSFTALVHPVALDGLNQYRIGILVRSDATLNTSDDKLWFALGGSGNIIQMLSEHVAGIGTAAFAWSVGNDYTLRLTVNGSSVLGEVWNGATAIGAPAAFVSGTSAAQGSATGVGFISTGGSAYFDNAVDSIPEPSTVLLFGLGGLLALWRRQR